MPALATASLLVAAAPAPATAPPRSPAEQDRLAALAQALGRAHALHRLCAGPADDRWRGAMQRLLAAERPSPALRERLATRFNAGFAEAGAAHHGCGADTRDALAQAAAEGRDLARGLAGATGEAL